MGDNRTLLYEVVLNSCLTKNIGSGMKAFTNSNGENVSPWKMPLLIEMFRARCWLFECRLVPQLLFILSLSQ